MYIKFLRLFFEWNKLCVMCIEFLFGVNLSLVWKMLLSLFLNVVFISRTSFVVSFESFASKGVYEIVSMVKFVSLVLGCVMNVK